MSPFKVKGMRIFGYDTSDEEYLELLRIADETVINSFTFDTKSPPASYYLKKAAKLKSGAKMPSRETAGSVTRKQLQEIAEAKMKDLNANSVEAAMQIILGSARSMGIEVKG